jgi:NAD(P)-dependent dehydrogenase (short-subunit alcohol dehydrogenase family)
VSQSAVYAAQGRLQSFGELLAGRSEGHRARCSGEQHDSQIVFERSHQLAHGGLRYPELASCGCEAAKVGDSHERPQVSELNWHRDSMTGSRQHCRRTDHVRFSIPASALYCDADAGSTVSSIRRTPVLGLPDRNGAASPHERARMSVVLITGTSSGFGRLTAETLARGGHHVYAGMRQIGGRNASAAAELSTLAEREDVVLRVVPLDASDAVSLGTAVTSVVEAAGRIDVLVNNIGIGSWGMTEAYDMEQVQQILESNFLTAVRSNRAVLPQMRAQGAGLLVQVSSGVGRFVMPYMTLYSAAKHAVDALAEGYHYELAPLGIDSVIVEPGSFPTVGSLTKLLTPNDTERVSEYGDVNQRGQAMYAYNDQVNRGPDAPNPQLVADAIAQLIDTPAGQRPMRTTIGPPPAPQAAQLNEVAAQIQEQTLTYMGLSDMLGVKAQPR